MDIWIYRISHNAVISEHRKWSKRETEPIEEYFDGVKQLMDDINIEEEFDKKIVSDVINKALANLPLNEREALELYYLEGFSIQEICDILKKPTGSIATLMRRGKQKLLKFINRSFPSLL